jgi:exopolyphosphatase/guanosine-5'-triphosphate,3'-diphosphate pyrophosphatase
MSLEETIPPIEIFLEKPVIAAPYDGKIVRRAAFDIGGGSIRVVVADVDIVENKITEKLFNGKVEILFRKELTQNPYLSDQIAKKALLALYRLKEKIAQYEPESYSAIATEAFRLAINGLSFLENLQTHSTISIKRIEQEMEGRLGFLSSAAASNAGLQNTVVIDVGTGSMQITGIKNDGSFDVFKTKLGHVALDEIIYKTLRGQSGPPKNINPVSLDEALHTAEHIQTHLADISPFLKSKLSSKDVKVIISCNPTIGEKVWQKESALQFLKDEFINYQSSSLTKPRATSKAILFYTLVTYFQIEECVMTGSDAREGSATGLLTMADFWKLIS